MCLSAYQWHKQTLLLGCFLKFLLFGTCLNLLYCHYFRQMCSLAVAWKSKFLPLFNYPPWSSMTLRRIHFACCTDTKTSIKQDYSYCASTSFRTAAKLFDHCLSWTVARSGMPRFSSWKNCSCWKCCICLPLLWSWLNPIPVQYWMPRNVRHLLP